VELKSTSLHLKRGLACENRVKADFEKKGYKTWAHRWKSPFGEMDLIFQSPHREWVLVEVKSHSQNMDPFRLLSLRQAQRLNRVRQLFESQWAEGRPVRLHLALVGDSIEVYEDVLCQLLS
jgi:Holliday junction resolvase-like predicted endonuclease